MNWLISKFKSEEQIKLIAIGISAIVTLTLALTIGGSRNEKQKLADPRFEENLEIFIPDNHVLFPIEVLNYEGVNAALGAKSFVDLISPETNRIVAKNIQVLRAPFNLETFALLVPVNIANALAQKGFSYSLLVLQSAGGEPMIVNRIKKKPRLLKVTYGDRHEDS